MLVKFRVRSCFRFSDQEKSCWGGYISTVIRWARRKHLCGNLEGSVGARSRQDKCLRREQAWRGCMVGDEVRELGRILIMPGSTVLVRSLSPFQSTQGSLGEVLGRWWFMFLPNHCGCSVGNWRSERMRDEFWGCYGMFWGECWPLGQSGRRERVLGRGCTGVELVRPVGLAGGLDLEEWGEERNQD